MTQLTFHDSSFAYVGAFVRGPYSEREPRSSLVALHREFFHHILEDEVDGLKDRQGDKREDGQQEEESGEVEEYQTHNTSAWRWLTECDVRTPD